MEQKRKLRLSQCMIVKNEESDIRRALSWGKGIVWEQIVVDTGSTDRTVEIAEEMGAKVYHFKWVDDFSAAKNYAIEQAKGDWIAFLDADEYFPPEEAKKLLPLLEKVDKTLHYSILTSWMQVREDGGILFGGSQIRIFRRCPGLRYRGRIHEELAMKGQKTFRSVDASNELAIFHTGYDASIKKNQGKGERNARLLLMELEERPEDCNLMGYLGDAYSVMGEGWEEEAKKWYYKAIAHMPETAERVNWRDGETFRRLMIFLLEGSEEELLRIHDLAVKRLPEESDFDYVLGAHYIEKKEYGKAASCLEKALQILEQYGSAGRSYMTSGNLAKVWYLLSLCHYQQGDLTKCLKTCTPLLKAEPYNLAAAVLFLNAMEQGEKDGQITLEQIEGLLYKIYDPTEAKARMFLVMAAQKAGYERLQERLSARCSQEELDCIRRGDRKECEKE